MCPNISPSGHRSYLDFHYLPFSLVLIFSRVDVKEQKMSNVIQMVADTDMANPTRGRSAIVTAGLNSPSREWLARAVRVSQLRGGGERLRRAFASASPGLSDPCAAGVDLGVRSITSLALRHCSRIVPIVIARTFLPAEHIYVAVVTSSIPRASSRAATSSSLPEWAR